MSGGDLDAANLTHRVEVLSACASRFFIFRLPGLGQDNVPAREDGPVQRAIPAELCSRPPGCYIFRVHPFPGAAGKSVRDFGGCRHRAARRSKWGPGSRMSTASLAPCLYAAAIKDGLKEYVYQFTSLSSLCQYEIVYQKTLEYLRPNMTVLDWGCGNGHFSYFLTQKMAKTIAFSFDDPPAYLSHRRGFEHVHGSPTESCKLPFTDRAISMI